MTSVRGICWATFLACMTGCETCSFDAVAQGSVPRGDVARHVGRVQRNPVPRGATFTVMISSDTTYAGGYVVCTAILRLPITPTGTATVPPTARFLDPPIYTPPRISGAIVRPARIDSLRREGTASDPSMEYRYSYFVLPLTSGADTLTSSLQFTAVNEADPYESVPTTLQAPRHVVVVRPLPALGRPRDFSGAVGQWAVSMYTDSLPWRVGTGAVVRVRISGTGNLSLLSPPELALSWASVAPLSDSITWDTTSLLPRGAREFRWLVTPQHGGPVRLPALQYSYFDPVDHRYVTATTEDVIVRVMETSTRHHATRTATRASVVSRWVQWRWIIVPLIVGVSMMLAVWVVRHRMKKSL